MDSPILVVGAGGIGCELIKDLILAGFSNLVIVDSDTIGKSNLNRQFLYRREDIGSSKAEVAARRVSSRCTVEGLNADITSFTLDFFRRFKLVLNALDNIKARIHVNRVCLALSLPLIDAGTQGKLGQVSTHIPKRTACYECEAKQTQVTYPICTLRSKPSRPVHTVAWAKMLFEELFTPLDTDLSDLKGEIRNKNSVSEVFQFLFSEDLPENTKALSLPEQEQSTRISEDSIPGLENCSASFVFSFEELSKASQTSFDKENHLCIEFITACSNLRSLNFDIPVLSMFHVKEIAGNIVPAVASTNAVAAGLQVIEAVKLVMNTGVPKHPWIAVRPTYKKIIFGGPMMPPKPNCYACSVGTVTVKCNLETYTLQKLIDEILIREIALVQPSVYFGDALLFECGDVEPEEMEVYQLNSSKCLTALGVTHGSSLDVDVSDI